MWRTRIFFLTLGLFLLTSHSFLRAQKTSFTSFPGENTLQVPVEDCFCNPVLPGFHPDPSICRVGDDYYLAVSSFAWYPGVPIYHSKDLVHWELIAHAIDRPDKVDLQDAPDNYGIYAPTLRYHNGTFYLITTNYKKGGNFYLTATSPQGPWSDPVWMPDAPGIDPSLFFDDDGRCYYTGNCWNFKKSWPSQCGIWLQELDVKQGKLVGERKLISYGHAANAPFAESPHLYKVDGRYLLLIAEGGTENNHAVTAHHASSVWGPYVPDKINPVLSHRQLGAGADVVAVGHADLVQTQQGDWWAVSLGKRMVNGKIILSRETFLSKVEFQEGTPIFNPGYGRVLLQQERPRLPWTPLPALSTNDEFETDTLTAQWYQVRTPQRPFYSVKQGLLHLSLQPEVVDSLVHASMLLQKVTQFSCRFTTQISFAPRKEDEQAGIILYRTNNSYYALLKEKKALVLLKKQPTGTTVVERIPYVAPTVCLGLTVDSLQLQFRYGETEGQMQTIGEVQDMTVLADDKKVNKFNGTGVGLYATSNGKKSKAVASYGWVRVEKKTNPKR